MRAKHKEVAKQDQRYGFIRREEHSRGLAESTRSHGRHYSSISNGITLIGAGSSNSFSLSLASGCNIKV